MALTILSIEIDPESTAQADTMDHDLRVVLENATVTIPATDRRRSDRLKLARLQHRSVNRRSGLRLRVKNRA
ncbi:MAG: hypothetical protein ACI9MR_002185 [Myxococcota bacterium]|jgi:hypothetical protein